MAYVEARLIVPTNENQDGDMTYAAYRLRLRVLERDLVHAFGGFTATEGRGAWDNGDGSIEHEPVCVYLIAVDSEDMEALLTFNTLRDYVKARLGQKAVYLSRTTIEAKPVQ